MEEELKTSPEEEEQKTEEETEPTDESPALAQEEEFPE